MSYQLLLCVLPGEILSQSFMGEGDLSLLVVTSDGLEGENFTQNYCYDYVQRFLLKHPELKQKEGNKPVQKSHASTLVGDKIAV